MSNFCDAVDCGPPGSSVHGVLQARTLAPGDLPYPGIEPQSLMSSALALYHLRYRGKPYITYTIQGTPISPTLYREPLYHLRYTGKPYITYAIQGNPISPTLYRETLYHLCYTGNPYITYAIQGKPISPTLYRETLYNLCYTGKLYITYAI